MVAQQGGTYLVATLFQQINRVLPHIGGEVIPRLFVGNLILNEIDGWRSTFNASWKIDGGRKLAWYHPLLWV